MHGDFVKLDGAKRKLLRMRLSVWFPKSRAGSCELVSEGHDWNSE